MTRSICFAVLLVLSMLFPAFYALPAFCDSKDVPKYVTVPVYYLTDRNKRGEGFGSRRRYPTQCLHEMYYGTMFVNVPNKEKFDVSQKECAVLGWKGSSEKAAKVSPKK